MDAHFPRQARLLDGTGYGQVFKKNKRLTNAYWIVLVHRGRSDSGADKSLETGSGNDARLGLAIAKKRAKRAVDRNRIKRIARESFRHKRKLLQGCDCVVMNKDRAATASCSELRQSLDMLWSEWASLNRQRHK